MFEFFLTKIYLKGYIFKLEKNNTVLCEVTNSIFLSDEVSLFKIKYNNFQLTNSFSTRKFVFCVNGVKNKKNSLDEYSGDIDVKFDHL